MSANHTPGPWKVRQAYDNGEPSCLVVHSGASGICDVYPGERISASTEIAQANAALIAAAPELLNALEIAEATLDRIAPDGSRATQGTRDVIRAALAKATP